LSRGQTEPSPEDGADLADDVDLALELPDPLLGQGGRLAVQLGALTISVSLSSASTSFSSALT